MLVEKILNGLNIRQGEGLTVSFLMLFSVFNGIFLAFYISIANSAFLSRWESKDLPLAYMVSGVLGFLVMRFYAKLERRFNFKKLLQGTLLIILGLVFIFWLGSGWSKSKNGWFSWMMLIWMGPILTLLGLSFWGLAGRLFDLRQAKRLFGLISSGEVLSAILSYLVILALPLSFKGVYGMLGIAVLGLLFSTLLVPLIVYRFQEKLEDEPKIEPVEPKARLKTRDPYFLLISVVAFLAVFNQVSIDFSVLTATDAYFRENQTPNALANFFAVFLGTMSFAELVVKSFLSGRVLGHFGMKLSLLFLPTTMFLGVSGIFIVVAGWEAASVAFFIGILIVKIVEHVLRFSIFDPSFKVLFQPLLAKNRFATQARVEGLVRQGGMTVTGLCLFLVIHSGQFRFVGTILLGLAIVWLVATLLLYREYRAKLMERLHSHSIKSIVPSPVEILSSKIVNFTAEEKIFAINVLEKVEPGLLEVMVPIFLDSEEKSIRASTLEHVQRLRLTGQVPVLIDHMEHEEDADLKAKTAEVIRKMRVFTSQHFSLDKLLKLGNSDQAEARQAAAIGLARVRGLEAQKLMSKLLWDPDPMVRRAAIVTAGKTKKPVYWSRLIDELDSGLYCTVAATALVSVGPPILETDFGFTEKHARPEVQIRIMRIYERIGGPKAIAFLLDKINYPHRDIRYQALLSLNFLGYRASAQEYSPLKNQILKLVEIIVWNMAARLDLGKNEKTERLYLSLKREVLRQFRSLYLILSFICDKQAIKLIRENFRGDAESRSFALEIAEEITPPDLKPLLFPFFEFRSAANTVARFALECPQETMDPIQRLADILAQGPDYVDSWTRACAVDGIYQMALRQAPDALIAATYHHDPVVREVAAWTVYRMDPSIFKRCLAKMSPEDARVMRGLIEAEESTGQLPRLLIFDKVLQLAAAPILSHIPEIILARRSHEVKERRVPAGTPIFKEGQAGDTLILVLEGVVRVHHGDQTIAQIGRNNLLGEIAVVETGVRTLSATAQEPVHMLILHKDWFIDLMADHLEIIPDIVQTIAKRRASH